MSVGSASWLGVGMKRPVPRVALVQLQEGEENLLRDCFRQFGIDTQALGKDAGTRFQKEKYEACALRLDDDAGAMLEAGRNSPSNRKMVIYGLCSNATEAIRYSKFGINAILQHPLERQATLKVVRATRLLVLNELRRYVRLPLVQEVEVDAGTLRFKGTTQEISAGGMSVETKEKLGIGQPVQLRFMMPGTTKLVVSAVICWVREGSLGARFDVTDDRRLAVKEWIDSFLDL